jgi:hypothetical protein
MDGALKALRTAAVPIFRAAGRLVARALAQILAVGIHAGFSIRIRIGMIILIIALAQRCIWFATTTE